MEHKIGYKMILWVDTTLIFESLLTTFDRKSLVKYLLFVTRVCRSKLLVPTEENERAVKGWDQTQFLDVGSHPREIDALELAEKSTGEKCRDENDSAVSHDDDGSESDD